MFTIDFYNNNAEINRVDKTSFLTYLTSVQGNLKEPSSIVNPIITFEYSGVPTFNYVKIADFNRYYFVSDIKSISNKLWQVTMKCDVLMSYATQIKENYANIGRYNDISKIQTENGEMVDEKFPLTFKTEQIFTEIPNTPFNNQIGLADANIENVVFRCMY